MRKRLSENLKEAMRAKDTLRLSTLRLINAAIKDKEIALRGDGKDGGVSNDEILAILAKMVKQRQDSANAYDEGGRLDAAEKERAEIVIIEEFLPRQLDEAEVNAAIAAAIKEVGASSIRDMGRVMGVLKANHGGQMDFGKAGGAVKGMLG